MLQRFTTALAAAVLFGSAYSCRTVSPATAAATNKYAGEGYHLVWADEFNKDGAPDTANWLFEKGFVRNEEQQWYQPANAWCSKGLLVLEARRETVPNPAYAAGSKDWRKNRATAAYTAACLQTKGLHSWKYGRFEMRGRIDTESGLWPAWWTLGETGEWPANGEIDIMEFYRGKLLANIASGTAQPYKALWHSNRFSLDSLGGKQWAAAFHTWRMDWDETAIALYVDNILLNKVPLAQLVNQDGSGINPFMQPHFMLLDLAIGGMNGGDPGHTTMPQHFEVDYVRVYQKK